MRKLLQNKAVVAGLAVVAAACIAGNFVRWPGRKGALAVAARVTSEVSAIDPAAFPVRSPLRLADRLIGWQDSARFQTSPRDPFRPSQLPSFEAQPVSATAAPAAAPTFTVQAISVEGDQVLAVVNRRVLAPGDRIEGYVVEAIQSTHVRLRGPAGPVTVSIRDPRRPARIPPAK